MDKKTVIIGGILAALGVVALVVLSRGNGSATQSPAVAAPLQIPSYPQAPPLPALNLVATPYYQTFNVAPDRNLIQPTDKTVAQSDSCSCKPCEQGSANAPVFSQAFVDKGAKSLQARFMLNAGNASSLIAQFPPDRFPWLYQHMGSA